MARPFWLRLFGPTAPTTLDDFRIAFQSLPFGQALGENNLIVKFRAILDLPLPTPGDHIARVPRDRDDDVSNRDLPMVAAAILTRPDLGIVAQAPGQNRPSTGEAGTAAPPAAGGEPGPNDAAHPTNHPIFSVQVELPWRLAYGLAPITGDSASEARREPDGWLEKYIHAHAVSQSITVAFMPDETAPHWESWAGPAQGTLTLTGDYAGGFVLTALPFRVDAIALAAGNNYKLISNDDFVASGGTLVIDGMALGAGEHVIFDGTHESDGRFIFYGSDAGDTFMGGAGNDLVEGRGGADILVGGGGGDTFIYRDAAESSGADYDTLADFDPTSDKIDLDVTVSGFDDAVAAGTLSAGSFDDDLAAALAGLGAGQAVYYAPDAGDLAGTVFLVVDANGIVGYQEGEDYVVALPGTTLADLSGHTDFFI